MRRGNVVLALAILVAAAICVRLGIWQLSRYQQKQRLNAERAARLAEPPVLWDGTASMSDLTGRRIALHGRYDSTRHVLLAYREHDGTTGVEVVTPLVPNGGRPVLVNRGWLPADDGVSARPQDFSEPGEVEVVGVAEPFVHGRFGVRRLESDSVTLFSTRALDADSVAARLGPVAPFVVRQTPGEGVPSRPRRSAPPEFDTGMHLAYAIQWFVIGAVVLGGGWVLLRLRSRSSERSAA